MHSLLGSYQGSKHKAPSMQADLQVLMDSLEQHRVYQLVKGRTFEGDDSPVKDTITTGLSTLKSALDDYNKAFRARQLRFRQAPVTRTDGPSESSPNQPNSTLEMNPSNGVSTVHSSSEQLTVIPATETSQETSVEVEDADGSDCEQSDVGGQSEAEDEEEAFECSTEDDVALDSDVESEEEPIESDDELDGIDDVE